MTAPARTDVLDDAQPSPAPLPAHPTGPAAERFVPAPRQRWERPALVALLLVSGALFLWDLSASGWANSYYSAAVQAGSAELEGLPVRGLGRRGLDHRRQAAGLAVGDGASRCGSSA